VTSGEPATDNTSTDRRARSAGSPARRGSWPWAMWRAAFWGSSGSPWWPACLAQPDWFRLIRLAVTVPIMVYDLLVGGMLSSALVPVFSEYAAARSRQELSRLVSTVLGLRQPSPRGHRRH